jgi:hypothetical protein
MSLPNLAESDLFRTWFNLTNSIVDRLNGNVVSDGVEVYGVYKVKKAANSSVNWCDGLTVNSSAIDISTNTTFSANVVVDTTVAIFNMAANTFIVQSVGGSRFDTALVVNAAATFLGNVYANATLSVNGNVSFTGNTRLTGPLVANGMISTRQIVFATTGAVAANTLASPQYDDFAPTGLAECQILNLTPNINAVLTGLVAPTVLGTSGGRVLHIQNLSDTYKLTLASANLSSSVNNRFKTPADGPVDIPPGGALSLLYTKTNNQWRVLAPQVQSSDQAFGGNVAIGGTLSVASVATFSANVAAAPLFIDQTNLRVGIGTSTPTVQFQTTGPALIGGLLSAASANISVLTSTGNVSLLSGSVLFSTVGNTVFVANTITANGIAVSFIRNLRADTAVVNTSLTTSNLIASGTTSLATVTQVGNSSFLSGAVFFSSVGNTVFLANTISVNGTANSFVRVLLVNNLAAAATINTPALAVSSNAALSNVTVSSRMVIPVGPNLWAT